MGTTHEKRLTQIAVRAHQAVIDTQERLDDELWRRRNAVRALHQSGWSLQRIADLLDISKTAVANICKAAEGRTP